MNETQRTELVNMQAKLKEMEGKLRQMDGKAWAAADFLQRAGKEIDWLLDVSMMDATL